MTAHRIPIDGLHQGTGNQHPAKKRPGQVDPATINIRFGAGYGAAKRNGADLIADLDLASADWYFASFKRRYLVCISPTTIRVFDMVDGAEEDVVSATGDFAYLSSMTAPEDVRTAALVETLAVLNRQVTTVANTSADYEVTGDVITFDELFTEPTQDDLDDGADDPTQAADGDVFEVLEDWNEARAGFYQKSIEDGEVSWTMIAPPNSENALPDETTLPHRLVHDTTNDRFVWEPCPWRERLSGDDTRNPAPSWFGSKLESISAHQGRLFLIGAGYITSGEVAAPRRSVFNLYDYNVDVPSEADRIEIAITDASLGAVRYSEAIGNDLVLLCVNGIDLFTSGNDPLTAFNGRDFKILDLPSADVRPATSGTSLYFLDQLERVHWLSYEGGAVQYQGAVNDHRQDILQGETVEAMHAVDQTLYIITESGSIKTLDRYLIPSGNYQLAWSQLEFYERPVFIGHYDNRTKLLTSSEAEGYSLLDYLHRQPIFLDEWDYEICLDRREAVAGTYDFSKDQTIFTLTGRNASLTDTVLVASIDSGGTRINQPLSPIRVVNNKAYFSGDWSGQTHYIGFVYESKLVLSKLWAGLTNVMPLLSRLTVIHRNATDYIVEMTVQGGDAEASDWSAAEIGLSSIGQMRSDTGSSTHFAFGDARETSVAIKSSSAGYFEVAALEYQVRTRGRT